MGMETWFWMKKLEQMPSFLGLVTGLMIVLLGVTVMVRLVVW